MHRSGRTVKCKVVTNNSLAHIHLNFISKINCTKFSNLGCFCYPLIFHACNDKKYPKHLSASFTTTFFAPSPYFRFLTFSFNSTIRSLLRNNYCFQCHALSSLAVHLSPPIVEHFLLSLSSIQALFPGGRYGIFSSAVFFII